MQIPPATSKVSCKDIALMLHVKMSLHNGLKAYGGSKQAPGTNSIVKEGDSFKIGQDIDVR